MHLIIYAISEQVQLWQTDFLTATQTQIYIAMLSGQLQQALALLNADLDKKVKIMGNESRRLMLRWRGIGRKGEQKWKDKDGLRLKKAELAHQG